MAETSEEKNVQTEPFAELLGERYLAYALSTITQRALPDVRDGMKPVHRRILYAMRALKLDPSSHFKRSSRVVGDVIGKFHPHGESAVYEALVRLAQDFSSRYPLVEGQGNFGNVDGDSAAAPRYTEARLSDVALALLQDIELETVDFRDNYDGTETEPMVLPSAFPNLLANGSNGIAVGMATSIPPHNVEELGLALIALIQDPHTPDEKICQFIPGPDFPTGGILVEPKQQVMQAYLTGRGGFRVRSRWERETLARGSYQIVVTEIPYQVQKSRLIEQLADIVLDKKNMFLADVRDESAEDLRVVLEPKNKAVDADAMMEVLFNQTDLESKISLNLNVLDSSGQPHVHSLKDALLGFLEHRRVVVLRRSQFRLKKIADRLEILEGLRLIYLDLDEVIRIIREEDEPRAELMRVFHLTERQADAILDTRLRALRKLEEEKLTSEISALNVEADNLRSIVEDKKHLDRVLVQETKDLIKRFGKKTALGRRRTSFQDAPVVDIETALKQNRIQEPVTLVLSKQGWVRLFKGHLAQDVELKFKEGDDLQILQHMTSDQQIMVFTKFGRVFLLEPEQLPAGRGLGEPLRLLVTMAADDDVAGIFVYQQGAKFLLASSDGRAFVVESDACMSKNRGGKQVMTLQPSITLKKIRLVAGDHVATLGENRKMLAFPIDDLPIMEKGRGVMVQKFKDGGLADIITFFAEEGLSWTDAAGRRQQVNQWEQYIAKRGNAGRMVPRGFNRNGRFDHEAS